MSTLCKLLDQVEGDSSCPVIALISCDATNVMHWISISIQQLKNINDNRVGEIINRSGFCDWRFVFEILSVSPI